MLLGNSAEKLRLNPRKPWYRNLDEVVVERRRRGDLPTEAAAARLYRVSRVGFHADLSVPRAGARHAAASDRHGAVQVRRVQAERIHQGRAQPGLLEKGPPLSRRHRLDDHQEPGDRPARLSVRQVRHDLAVFLPGAAAERHAEAGPAGDLPAGADQRQPQRDPQPREAAVQQSRIAPRGGADRRSAAPLSTR